MAKVFNVSFNISGNLDASLTAALANASKMLRGLGAAAKTASAMPKLTGLSAMARSLGTIQQAADKFWELKKASSETAQALPIAQKQVGQLARQSREDAAKVSDLKKALSDFQTAQLKAKADKSAGREQLKMLRASLSEARKIGDKAQVSALTAAISAQREKINSAAQSYKELSDKVKQTKAELKSAETALTNSTRGFESARARASNLKTTLREQLEALQRLRSQLGAAGFNTASFVSSERALHAELSRVNQELQRQQQLLQSQASFRSASSDLSTKWGEFQSAISTAQTLMTPFSNAADNAMTFEKSMSRLKSLTQMENLRSGKIEQVNSEMAELEATISKLGATTEYTANEIIGAANKYAMSGWNESQIKAVLSSTVDLASITQTPIERVADMFSDDMMIMGIKAGEQIRLPTGELVDATKNFADQISFAVSKANFDYATLHNSLTYNAPAMRLAGISRGDILAANMVSANAGLKGSVSGTALRTGFIRMLAPAKKGAQALEELGLSAGESQAAMESTAAAMKNIGISGADSMIGKLVKIKERYDELAKIGDKNGQAAMINDIFGKHGFSTWANLFEGTNLETMKSIGERLNSAEMIGWSADTAKVMRDNTRTAIDYLTSAMDALQRESGNALTPAIRQAAEAITPLITRTAEFVRKNPQLVKTIAGVAASLAAATVAVAGFSLAMAGVRFAQAGFKTAKLLFADVASYAGKAAGALRGLTIASAGGALKTGLSVAASAAKSFGRACLFMSRAALGFILTPVGAILAAIALAGLWAYENWDRVAPVLKNIADTLSEVMRPAIDSAKQACSEFATTVGNALEPIMPVLKNVASFIGGGLAGAFIGLGGVVASVLSGVVVGIAGLIKTVANLGTDIAKALKQFSDGDYRGAFQTMSKAGSEAAKNIERAHLDAFAAIEKGISATSKSLENLSRMKNLPNAEVRARHKVDFDEQGVAHSTPVDVSNVKPIDTSELQQSVDAASTAMSGATTSTNGLMVAALLGTPALAAVAYTSQNASVSVGNLGGSADTATSGVDGLGNSAAGAQGGVNNLGDAAGGAAGNVASLGDAALSAISALMSAASSAVDQAWSAIKFAVTGHGGGGGGFARGGFVDKETTYYAGEHGREVIIPLTEHRRRAEMLWQQAGQMLGFLPKWNSALEAQQRAQWSIKRVPAQSGLKIPAIKLPSMPTTPLPTIKPPIVDVPYQTPPTFPQIDLPQGEEISARQSKRRRPQGTMPPIKMPRRETPKFLDVLGRALGGGLIGDNRSAINMPRIDIPPMTFPTIEQPTEAAETLPDLRQTLSFGEPRQNDLPPITLNVTVNINGNADETTVKRGVVSALPTVQRSLREQLIELRREERRRSFA